MKNSIFNSFKDPRSGWVRNHQEPHSLPNEHLNTVGAEQANRTLRNAGV